MRLRIFLLFLALTATATSTTVVPPTFPELVSSADLICRGRVVSVVSRRVERQDGGGTVIKTFVTFAIGRALKGAAQPEIVLEFLGGTVGDETLEIAGVPQFTAGAEEILFVQKNGRQFCPLVAVMHGRYRVEREPTAQRDYIARENRTPLNDPADVVQPMSTSPVAVRAASADLSRALTPAAFEARIVAEVSHPTLRAQVD